mgnify:CR=1 FL=1
MGPIEALKASNQATRGHLIKLLYLSLATIGIMILGMLFFMVGMLIAYPVTMLAQIYVYRKLSGGKVLAMKETTPVTPKVQVAS